MPQVSPDCTTTHEQPADNRAQRRSMAGAVHRLGLLGIRPKFVSVDVACDYLNCGRAYFYATYLHRVKSVRHGRSRQINFDSLEALGDKILAEGGLARTAGFRLSKE